MEKLYERLLELLHKSPRSQVVRKFLREIPEAPTIEKNFGTVRSYHFPRHGFRFDSDVGFGYIWWICLYMEHANGWEVFYQDYQPFVDELPFHIQKNDTRNSVREKIGRVPTRTLKEPRPAQVPDVSGEELENWIRQRARDPLVFIRDTYNMQQIRLLFSFRISDERLTTMSIFKDGRVEI